MLEKVIAKNLPSFVILFRMHERGTASEKKFDIVLQFTLEHVVSQRLFK